MKLACSSAVFDAAIARGGLTQLEWLDACAVDLDVDGLVFEARHFPRNDAEYLAQLKKMASDLGLSVAALACDDVLASGDAGPWFAVAVQLGAPLVVARAPVAGDEPGGWNTLVGVAKASSAAAKRANVTLAVRNAEATLCPSPSSLQQLAKEVDSSWLRFAPDPLAFDPPEPLHALASRVVLAAHALGAGDAGRDATALLDALAAFRGFLVVDALPDALDDLRRFLGMLRSGVAQRALAGAGA